MTRSPPHDVRVTDGDRKDRGRGRAMRIEYEREGAGEIDPTYVVKPRYQRLITRVDVRHQHSLHVISPSGASTQALNLRE